MIRIEGESPGSSVRRGDSEEPARPPPLAFATLWCSGPDPRRDVLLRLQALRVDVATGIRESFSASTSVAGLDSTCDEALAIGARDFGLGSESFAGAPSGE